MEITIFSHENISIDTYLGSNLLGLEYAWNVVFLSEDPSSFLSHLNDIVGNFKMCLATSNCIILLQDSTGSYRNLLFAF